MPILDKIQPKILRKTQDKVAGILGPELQPNWDMSKGIDVWIPTSEVTFLALIDNGEKAVKLTSLVSSGGGNMPISGLTVGKTYRLIVRARTGTGSTQKINNVTWATLTPPLSSVTSSDYINYSFDLTATSTSGNVNMRASLGGQVGDELIVSEISIREVL